MTIRVRRLIPIFATMKRTTEYNIKDGIPDDKICQLMDNFLSDVDERIKNETSERRPVDRNEYNSRVKLCNLAQLNALVALANYYHQRKGLEECIEMPKEEAKMMDLEGAVKAVAEARPQIATKISHFVGICILCHKRGHDVGSAEMARYISKYFRKCKRQNLEAALPYDFRGDGEDIDSWLKLNGKSQKNKMIVEVAKIASPFIPNLRKKIS